MIKNKIWICLIMVLSIFATSCDKFSDFGDTNVNPNGIPEPIPSALFTSVSAGIPGYASIVTPGYYAQYFSETQYSGNSLYTLIQGDFSGAYSGELYDLQNIINGNTSNNLTQASRILQQYIFWTITDRYGDIPYSEALKGSDIQYPKYDTQEEIYKGMIATLKDAASKFDNTSVIGGDISDYNKDVNRWKKLANSLRLLMAQQLSKRYPGASDYAATEYKAALAAGVMESNDDSWSYTFPGGNISNPWYNTYNGRRDIGESNTMTGVMTKLGDARQKAYGADVNDKYTELGVPYGWERAKVDPWTQNNPTWAYVLAKKFRQQTSKVTVIPAAVIALSRAEAANRGWTNEDEKALYEKGIRLSFEQWEVGTPSASYLSQSDVALGAPKSDANWEKIILQRYIATYPDGLQAWNLWRRTGIPVLTRAPDATNSSDGYAIPRRYTYAPSLYTTNKAGIEAAVARLTGGDKMSSRIWWDK